MFNEWFTNIVNWSAANPAWAGVVIFLISMSESLFVVGFFVPGLLAMGAIGGLVSKGALPLIPTLIWAIAGAIVGDGIGYAIGRVYKDSLSELWVFRRFPKLLNRSKIFFNDYGSLSVVIGRFVGPVRPFIPAVAGIMSMCPRQFLVANVISAALWAPIYMAPGYSLTKFLSG